MDPRANVGSVLAVLDQLIPLLAEHGHPDGAGWLGERATLLRDVDLPEAKIVEILHYLHRICPGMGGLTDLELGGTTTEDRLRLREHLLHLTDDLFELTPAPQASPKKEWTAPQRLWHK
jgi:hypothetical protein